MFYMVLKTNVSILQVSLYMDKFAGVCQAVLHDCKLTFLQIICDHDLFVEMPGRDPSDR
jgi:dedicator of cytokinesis protein 6/7/8